MSQNHRENGTPAAEVPEEVRTAWAVMENDEPPALLDQAVLNRAHAAVAPAPTKRPWSFGWLHTATTAAVIVLGVTLILQLRDQAPGAGDLPPSPQPSADAATGERAAEAPAERARLAVPAEVREEDVAATSGPERLDDTPAADAAAATLEAAPVARQSNEQPTSPQVLQRAAEPAPRAPEAWLAEIRRLIADGALDEARTSLEAFRETWPAYPLPEDLRATDLLPGTPPSEDLDS